MQIALKFDFFFNVIYLWKLVLNTIYLSSTVNGKILPLLSETCAHRIHSPPEVFLLHTAFSSGCVTVTVRNGHLKRRSFVCLTLTTFVNLIHSLHTLPVKVCEQEDF